MPTKTTRPPERILAEWRALEHVVEQTTDLDDEEAIRERIAELRSAYRDATGTERDPEPRSTQQLELPLKFAPRVVASSPRSET